MDYRLVTYQCLHFKIVAQHDYNLNQPDDYSPEGLFSTPTSTQRHSNLKCGSTECEIISKEQWSARVHEAIYRCKQYLSIAVLRYLEAAFRYHSTAPGTRASTLNDHHCDLAHQQFGIEICSWEDDPFFEDWQGCGNTLHDLGEKAIAELDDDGLAGVVAIINETRATLSGVQDSIASLAQGVAIIQATQQRQQQSDEWMRIVEKPSMRCGTSGMRKDTRALSGAVAPMEVFRRVVYQEWEQRILGLWETYHME
ncbi:hypothetical protein Slin15195_G052420 [Septoria linicola]|uniref:Uncharacterized protein n=1 Tax=Septoria linicola TaxID=215465 RepID=A0A9Q9ARM8_9PEZI|nr:hypothetical protein Slin14017_G127900 [Septoria linicola]USW51923.1 hypothetical protein Slin15195_G052420 [Septoria linicola]